MGEQYHCPVMRMDTSGWNWAGRAGRHAEDVPQFGPRRSRPTGAGKEPMEAFIILASGVCALIGVNLARFGNSDLDRAIRQANKSDHDRKAIAKALGYE